MLLIPTMSVPAFVVHVRIGIIAQELKTHTKNDSFNSLVHHKSTVTATATTTTSKNLCFSLMDLLDPGYYLLRIRMDTLFTQDNE